MTTIEVFQKAAELGLRLGTRPGNKLTFQPVERCPKDFFDTLSQHKWHLLVLLQLPFVMVYSKAFEETIFSCEDEDTKAALVGAGAELFSIYTRAELEVLVKANRVAPLTIAELTKLNEIKRTSTPRLRMKYDHVTVITYIRDYRLDARLSGADVGRQGGGIRLFPAICLALIGVAFCSEGSSLEPYGRGRGFEPTMISTVGSGCPGMTAPNSTELPPGIGSVVKGISAETKASRTKLTSDSEGPTIRSPKTIVPLKSRLPEAMLQFVNPFDNCIAKNRASGSLETYTSLTDDGLAESAFCNLATWSCDNVRHSTIACISAVFNRASSARWFASAIARSCLILITREVRIAPAPNATVPEIKTNDPHSNNEFQLSTEDKNFIVFVVSCASVAIFACLSCACALFIIYYKKHIKPLSPTPDKGALPP